MSFYTKSQRHTQERFDTRALANAMEAGIVEDKIGLLFIDFETPHRVRVQAKARPSAHKRSRQSP